MEAKNFRYYYNRALAFEYWEQYQKAIGDYETIIEFKPNLPQILFRLGRLQVAVGRYRKAIDYLNDAIERSSDQPAYYLNRALAHEGAGSVERAIEDIHNWVRLVAASDEAQMDRAMKFFLQGRTSDDKRVATKLADYVATPSVVDLAKSLKLRLVKKLRSP